MNPSVKQKAKFPLRFKFIIIILSASLIPLVILMFVFPHLLNSLLLFIFAVGIFTTLTAFILTTKLLKPIEQVINEIDLLKNGQMNSRLDIRSGDELETLGQSFNLMIEDIRQMVNKQEQSRDFVSSERNKLNAVLSSVLDGIIAIDLSGKVVLINPSACRITGYSEAEVINKPLASMIRLFNDGSEIPMSLYCPININTGSSIYNSNGSLKLIGKNGKEGQISLFSSQISHENSQDLACILIFHDLSKDQELEKMKLDFVSMASHELRTPLTSILGYLSVFMDENKGKLAKDQTDLLDRVFISTKQLITLVENLLNVNKIERERLSVTVVSLDWKDQLAKAFQDLKNMAVQKNINMNLHLPQNPLPKVAADPILISEVLNNLISNAINYTHQGGSIDIYTQLRGEEVVTTIADSGAGIPQEAIPHLFTKFFRVSGTLEPGSKGTGLGLYISHSIIEKLGGRIWVESELGKGSRFSFSLPVAVLDRLGGMEKAIQSEIAVSSVPSFN